MTSRPLRPRRQKKYFEDSSDTYGVDLARRNLASALAAIPEREGEANALIGKIHSESEEPDDGRMRAWLCNLLVRRFRSERRLEEALGHANEAIKIGQQLGDQYLVAINEIGAGNVYRDMGRYQEAIDSYSNAGISAQRCGRRDIEARASRLTAAIYNRMAGDAERGNVEKFARMAAQFARHAAGLLDSTAAFGERGRALEALGDALQTIGEKTQAAHSYYGAAAAFWEAAESDEFEAALMTASHIAVDADDLQTYLSGLRLAFGIPEIATDPSSSVVDELYGLTGQMISRLERSIAIPVFGFHFATMFSKVPPLVARHLFGRILDEFFSKTEGDQESWRLLFLSLVLCAAFKSNELRPFDLAQLSERISKKINGLTYKPRPGGGGHWVLTLSLREKVICSINQLDDSVDTTMAAMFIAFFLKGFEEKIVSEILVGVTPTRRELNVMVANIAEMPEDIRSFVSPHLNGNFCAVTRPTSPDDDTAPTLVSCEEHIGDNWGVGEGRGGALQSILGLTLLELVYSMAHGEIELETLKPKIVSVIRETIS